MPSPRPASDHAICRHAAEVLAPGRPVPADELARRLEERGVVLGANGADRVERVLDADSRFVGLDAGWASVAALLDGTTWTTTVDEEAAARGHLLADPDLILVSWWAMDASLELEGAPGKGVWEETAWDDEVGEVEVLAGPDGWLEGLAGTVALEVRGDHLALRPLDTAPPPHPDQVAAVRRSFERTASRDELPSTEPGGDPVEITSALVFALLWEALAADRDAFTAAPVAPVGELLTAAGLTLDGPLALGPDVDPAGHRRLMFRRRIAATWHLDPRQVDMAELVIGASSTVVQGDPLAPPDEEEGAAVLLGALLTDPLVCRAVWGHHLGSGTDPGLLSDFALLLLDHAEGELWGGAGWLAGRALDHAGDAPGAEAVLEDAVRHAPDHPLACTALAAFRADRGDARGAMELLRRAGDHADEDLLDEVEPFANARPRPAARRNDPCPCGSGRKYKMCHLGREELALEDRAGWLYDKAIRYVRDGRCRQLHLELASTASAASGGGIGLLDALDAECVFDVTLHEAGVWQDFLAERQHLLPEDEALLAASWQLVERSVFEVEGLDGAGLQLRDLRSGDRLVVGNLRPGPQISPGSRVWGRPLPVGDTWRAFSGILPARGALADELVSALDDADADEVAELVGRSFAPPLFANTEGHPLVFHELTYDVDDPAGVPAALASVGFDGDGDDVLTLVRDTPGQARTVILNARLEGNRLVVSANSDARAEEAERLVALALPGAVLVERDHRTLGELMEAGDGDDPQAGGGPALPGPSPDDPELVAFLTRHVRDYEERWLDLDIPALGGRTPREAAQDPVGRHELERLIGSMPPATDPTQMDPARLRRLLGLS
jgi:hypothetical protein